QVIPGRTSAWRGTSALVAVYHFKTARHGTLCRGAIADSAAKFARISPPVKLSTARIVRTTRHFSYPFQYSHLAQVADLIQCSFTRDVQRSCHDGPHPCREPRRGRHRPAHRPSCIDAAEAGARPGIRFLYPDLPRTPP